MKRGFTVIQLLVVIVILAILAAILFPVFAQAKGGGRKVNCLNSEKQLGMALSLYAGDQEDKSPTSKPGFFPGAPLGLGWAGAIFPYAKRATTFQCPNDSTHVSPVAGGPTPLVVSYGLNSNLSFTHSLTEVEAPANSVQLFEVAGSSTHLLLPDEGAAKGATVSSQFSAIGDGTYGGILATTVPWTGKGQGRLTRYATGVLDNAGSADSGDDYQDEPARHGEGANWLAMDSHAAWARPMAVSAGLSAKSATNAQRRTGCAFMRPDLTIFACAEGSGVGKHKLTFSLR